MTNNEDISLKEKEAVERLSTFGYNEINITDKVSPLKILLRQVRKNYVFYLLVFACLISFFIGKLITAYTILGVIVIVVVVGFFQEYKAEKSIEALGKMIMPVSIVIRDGKEKEILTREIVPDDIILLRPGERVPADCLILSQKELSVDESILTGESKEIKKTHYISGSVQENNNLVFMGTFVTNGKAEVKALKTGVNTNFGKIAGMISKAEKELPLQDKVNKIMKYVVTTAIICAFIIGIIMMVREYPLSYQSFIEILIVVLAVAVAAFPEGYPVVLITILASGAYRMAKKNAIVTRMSIIETLGETTIICTDKTGTITTGEMTVKKIFFNDKTIDITGVGYEGNGEFLENNQKINPLKNHQLHMILKTGLLCNDSRIERKGTDKEYNTFGSHTEASLLVLGAKANIYKEDFNDKRIDEIPFSSDRMMMSVVVKEGFHNIIYSKGATEILLKKCRFIQKGNDISKLTKEEIEKIHSEIKQVASTGFRTVGFAYKMQNEKINDMDNIETDLIFLGFASLHDPPREEVKESIMLCKNAGIKVKMLTGDHKETSLAIASQIGLDGKVIEGFEIDRLDDKEFSKVINDYTLFARLRPEHKLRIVKALKANSEIVTMTGDGINDAPALKEAHIGVAMGKNGSDASKASADLILQDNNFSTIVDAIKEGRTIFSNIQKFSAYQISINIAQMGMILLSAIIGLPLPLIAIQILLMNIISDELTALSLAFNPYSKDVMNIGPRKKSEIIPRKNMKILFSSGILMTIGAILIFYYVDIIKGESINIARTAVFVTMTFFIISNAFNFRSFRKPIAKLDFLANPYLLIVSIISILLTVILIYTPINAIFEMTPIPAYYWAISIISSIMLVFILDMIKKLINEKNQALT